MQIPETTSAEGLEHYIHGNCRAAGHGEAWRDIRASIFTAPSKGSVLTPAVSEPVLIWTTSGEVEVEERVGAAEDFGERGYEPVVGELPINLRFERA